MSVLRCVVPGHTRAEARGAFSPSYVADRHTITYMDDDLQMCLATALPSLRDLRISPPTVMNAGWECDLYSCTLEHGATGARQTEGIVLRVFPGDGAAGKAAHEYDAIHKLNVAGYPTPHVYGWVNEGSPFGHPFIIMEHVNGTHMWEHIGAAPEARQRELHTQFAGLLAQLHALDAANFTNDAALLSDQANYAFIDGWVTLIQDYVGRFGRAEYLPTLAWLSSRRAQLACTRSSAVHMDFHPANILIRSDGAPVVIDWTGFQISDARIDLGWTLVLLRSYEGEAGSDFMLNEYERLTGKPLECINEFVAMACIRRLFSISVSLLDGAEKLGMRPAAAATMRQQAPAHRRVYDLLVSITGLPIPEFERLLNSIN